MLGATMLNSVAYLLDHSSLATLHTFGFDLRSTQSYLHSNLLTKNDDPNIVYLIFQICETSWLKFFLSNIPSKTKSHTWVEPIIQYGYDLQVRLILKSPPYLSAYIKNTALFYNILQYSLSISYNDILDRIQYDTCIHILLWLNLVNWLNRTSLFLIHLSGRYNFNNCLELIQRYNPFKTTTTRGSGFMY